MPVSMGRGVGFEQLGKMVPPRCTDLWGGDISCEGAIRIRTTPHVKKKVSKERVKNIQFSPRSFLAMHKCTTRIYLPMH